MFFVFIVLLIDLICWRFCRLVGRVVWRRMMLSGLWWFINWLVSGWGFLRECGLMGDLFTGVWVD